MTEMVDKECVNHSAETSRKSTRKERKLWSTAWVDFDRKRTEDGILATCKHCKYEMPGNSESGTTRLHNHLKRCMPYRRKKGKEVEKGQLRLKAGGKKPDGTAEIECFKFDQGLSRQKMTNMFILHEYPFSMAEHVGFRDFVSSLQPDFKLLSRTTVQGDFKKTFQKEKQKIYDTLGKLKSRVNLTADMWTALGNVGYLCMTCHFIDEKWKLVKKILNFVYVESPHGAEELAKVILEHVYAWNIDTKLFSFVLDNCSTNDKMIKEILDDANFKMNLLEDGEFFHSRCCAHILNLIVQTGLGEIHEIVDRVRSSVKYVKKSQARQECFKKCAQQIGAPEKALTLDCPTRWNSTYLMLENALEFKKVFSRLPGFDKSYKSPPTSEDWDNVQLLVDSLVVFVDATERLSGTKYPTLNYCFNEIYTVHVSLKTWCDSPHPFISAMAQTMTLKKEKYWGKTNFLFTAACILDPRFKMKSVEYFFGLVYESWEVDKMVESVRTEFVRLYGMYKSRIGSSSVNLNLRSFGKEQGSNVQVHASDRNSKPSLRKNLGQFLQSTSSQHQKSDLDIYLDEGIVVSDDDDFDVLEWWKVHEAKYSILSAMARDILAIPASTVASESAFSTGGRVVDQYRSRLDPDTVETLICGQDWLRHEVRDSTLLESEDALSTLFSSLECVDVEENLPNDNCTT